MPLPRTLAVGPGQRSPERGRAGDSGRHTVQRRPEQWGGSNSGEGQPREASSLAASAAALAIRSSFTVVR